MDPALLRSRFRRALRVSFFAALPALPVLTACGGAVDTPTNDGGTSDGAVTDAIVDSGTCHAIDIPVTGTSCGYQVTLSGDLSLCGFPTDGGQISASVCQKLCGPQTGPATQYCYYSGGNSLTCGNACVGRRPKGLEPARVVPSNPVAAYFVDAGFLEAASIDAFQILHDELAHHGAPRDLRKAALSARGDEIRHASIVAALAARYGGVVEPPVVHRPAPRTLEAIALENAVEGCVRETWGALLASWQAAHAKSAQVRSAMRMIARDEAEHALLGLRVAQWIDRALTPEARDRIAAARTKAIADLRVEIAREPDEAVRSEVGLPSAREAALLVDSLFNQLDALSSLAA